MPVRRSETGNLYAEKVSYLSGSSATVAGDEGNLTAT